MEYKIGSAGGWINTPPQTGESAASRGHLKKAILLLSFSSGVCLPFVVEHTGYEIPLASLNASYPLVQSAQKPVVPYSHNALSVTDQIKRVFGLNISKQSQIYGVSRQTVHNWRNGEEPTGKNLEALMDLYEAAKLFESEDIQITGLLLRRPFFDGRSLQDLMEAQTLIYPSAKMLIEQIKREIEEKKRLERRFLGRQSLPNITIDIE